MVRIAYIVLTCEKYVGTRVAWQKETVFSSVLPMDLFYLGHTIRPHDRIFSWGAKDDYDSLPYKFADFFRWSKLNYDWYFLMDDDTYVYTDRLQARVEGLVGTGVDPRRDPYMEGHLLTHLANTPWGIYPSGGAGTLMTAKVYEGLCRIIRGVPETVPVPHWCADICLGLWARRIPSLRMKHSDQYHTDVAVLGAEPTGSALTFHHLKRREDYLAHRALSG